jgi:hypothetical protein
MKKISGSRLPAQTNAFITLKPLVLQTLITRQTMLSHMSGYPVPNTAKRLLYERIKLSSMYELLQSLVSLRDLARLASELLKNVSLARLDRQQFVRTELESYIATNAKEYGVTLTPKDIDFVSFLIASSELPEHAWQLQMSKSVSDNRFIQFAGLYQTLHSALSNPPTSDDFSKLNLQEDADAAASSYAHPNAVKKFSESKRVIGLLNENIDAPKTEKQRIIASIDAAKTQTIIANINIVDHIFMLLQDIEVWNLFITPRRTADAAENVQRAEGLALFAGYLHALLISPNILFMELFMQGAKKLESISASFPSLEAELKRSYDEIVLGPDVFNMSGLAMSLLDSGDVERDPLTGSSIKAFPIEVTSIFKLDKSTEDVKAAANKVPSFVYMTHIRNIISPSYQPILSGVSVGVINLLDDLSSVMLKHDIVKQQTLIALQALVPAMGRFINADMIRRLKGIGFNNPLPFPSPSQMQFNPLAMSEGSTDDGTLDYDVSASVMTYDLQYIMRYPLLATLTTASAMAALPTSSPVAIVNKQLGKTLRQNFNYEWRSHLPSNMVYGNDIIRPSDMKGDNGMRMKNMLESMTGMSYDQILLTIDHPNITRMYATYLSGMGIIVRKSSRKGGDPTVVEGFGHPYGAASYAGLYEKNTDGVSIPLSNHLNFVFYQRIPLPSNRMRLDEDMYNMRSHYYFEAGDTYIELLDELPAIMEIYTDTTKTPPQDANSAKDVNPNLSGKFLGFVPTPGLLQFTLQPVVTGDQPELKFSNAYKGLFDGLHVYMQDAIYLQVSTAYTLPAAKDTVKVSIPTSERKWNDDRMKLFSSYITCGGYTKAASPSVDQDASLISEVVDKLEKQMDKVTKESDSATIEQNPKNVIASVPLDDIVADNANIASEKGGKVSNKDKKKSTDKPASELKPEDADNIASAEDKEGEEDDAKKKKK